MGKQRRRLPGLAILGGTVLAALLAVWGVRAWYQVRQPTVIRGNVPQIPRVQDEAGRPGATSGR